MDNPSPAATAEGYDPPPSPEPFFLSNIHGDSLPHIPADGLTAAIDEALEEGVDEIIFGPGEILTKGQALCLTHL